MKLQGEDGSVGGGYQRRIRHKISCHTLNGESPRTPPAGVIRNPAFHCCHFHDRTSFFPQAPITCLVINCLQAPGDPSRRANRRRPLQEQAAAQHTGQGKQAANRQGHLKGVRSVGAFPRREPVQDQSEQDGQGHDPQKTARINHSRGQAVGRQAEDWAHQGKSKDVLTVEDNSDSASFFHIIQRENGYGKQRPGNQGNGSTAGTTERRRPESPRGSKTPCWSMRFRPDPAKAVPDYTPEAGVSQLFRENPPMPLPAPRGHVDRSLPLRWPRGRVL
jgi:hypothetical protein